MVAWTQIGCAVDFSAHSWAALVRAADLARRLDAQLTLVHVIPPALDARLLGADRVLDASSDRTLGKLDEWRGAAERAVGRAVRARFFTGSPIAELVRFAAGLDLLVVGTRGPTGLGRLLLGSVAERVARDAPCPVMVVHERAEEAARELRSS